MLSALPIERTIYVNDVWERLIAWRDGFEAGDVKNKIHYSTKAPSAGILTYIQIDNLSHSKVGIIQPLVNYV